MGQCTEQLIKFIDVLNPPTIMIIYLFQPRCLDILNGVVRDGARGPVLLHLLVCYSDSVSVVWSNVELTCGDHWDGKSLAAEDRKRPRVGAPHCALNVL